MNDDQPPTTLIPPRPNRSSDRAGSERWLIVGAGSFGTAFAHVMDTRAVQITLATRSPEHAAAMRASGTNEKYFPGVRLPSGVTVSTFEQALDERWDTVVIAVPAKAFGETLERFASSTDGPFLSLAKGLAPDGRRLSEVAGALVDPSRVVVLTGPNIAHEIVHDLPTAAVLAGSDPDTVRRLQHHIHGPDFRVYANDDVIGAELAGACKNVVAIAAGVCEAAGFGDNGLGAIMTRGFGEVVRLGCAMGAQLHTFLGLAGMGDLITTCASPYGRNRRAGQLLARGLDAESVRAEIGQVVEGLRTAPIMRDLGDAHGITMNVCTAVALIAEGKMDLPEVIQRLVSTPPSDEFDPQYGWNLHDSSAV